MYKKITTVTSKELTLMRLYISIPALVAAGLLSACASDPISQLEGGVAFLETLEGESTTIAVEDLPDSATMNGYLAANYSDRPFVYLGDATAEFNFQNNTLSGSATNFNEYDLSDVSEGESMLTAEKTRALDGSVTIFGSIDGTNFEYLAGGQLTAEVEEIGTLTANVSGGGNGAIFSLDDKLTATAVGEGDVDLIGEDGYVGEFGIQTVLGLQE